MRRADRAAENEKAQSTHPVGEQRRGLPTPTPLGHSMQRSNASSMRSNCGGGSMVVEHDDWLQRLVPFAVTGVMVGATLLRVRFSALVGAASACDSRVVGVEVNASVDSGQPGGVVNAA